MATKQSKVEAVNAWHPSGARRKARAAHYTAERDAWITEARRIYAGLAGGDQTTMVNRITAGIEVAAFDVPKYPSGIIETYHPSGWSTLATTVST